MLAQEQLTAASKEKVLEALGEAASKLRTGNWANRWLRCRSLDVPLLKAATSSLVALQACSLGNKARNEKGLPRRPIPIFPSSKKPRRSTRSCSSDTKALSPGPSTSPDSTWFKAAAWEDKTRCIMSAVFGIELGNFNGRVVVVKFKKTIWQVG
jgi:hypothetical protein